MKSIGYYDNFKWGQGRGGNDVTTSPKCWIKTDAFETQWMRLLTRNRKVERKKYFYAQMRWHGVVESTLYLE